MDMGWAAGPPAILGLRSFPNLRAWPEDRACRLSATSPGLRVEAKCAWTPLYVPRRYRCPDLLSTKDPMSWLPRGVQNLSQSWSNLRGFYL